MTTPKTIAFADIPKNEIPIVEFPIIAFNQEFSAFDIDGSLTIPCVMQELEDISVPDPKLIVDIGANVGLWSMFMAKKYPNAQIIAYEPLEINLHCFRLGVAKNNLTNITIVPWALSDIERELTFYMDPSNSGSSSAFNVVHFFLPGLTYLHETTKALALNDVITDTVDLMKVDVEGEEFRMFNNFRHWDKIKALTIEAHPLMMGDRPGLSEELWRLITSNMPGRRVIMASSTKNFKRREQKET